MRATAVSPLFALQGDDGLRSIPPFLQPNAVEPVVSDVSGDDRQDGDEMDYNEKSLPHISTPIICVITVIAILATAALFWSIKRWRRARQKHEEDGSNNLEKGDTSLNDKIKIGWRKLHGNRKRQSTWFDIATGQHFAEVLPSSSTICYITNVSTEHLIRDVRHPRTNSVIIGYSEARKARRPFSNVSSEYSISGQQDFPLQIGDIRHVPNDETLPPIDFSPLSIYSQHSLPEGLCKPISPLKLKPRVLHHEHPTLIPLQSTDTSDPFHLGTTPIMAERTSKVEACLTSDSHMDSTRSPIDQDGKMHSERTRTANATSPWHFPSPSVTACIIRNSIYHHQSPPSKSRRKPPTTADSDAPAFEYDDSGPTAKSRPVISGEPEDSSSGKLGTICSELATTYIVPAGLQTAALSSRRDAPRIRRRTSHNFLSVGRSAASWSSNGNTSKFAQTSLEPKTELLPTWTQASNFTLTTERDNAADLNQNLGDLGDQDTLQNSPLSDRTRLGGPQDPQESLLYSPGRKHVPQLSLDLEAMKQVSQRQITPSHADLTREKTREDLRSCLQSRSPASGLPRSKFPYPRRICQSMEVARTCAAS